jgi:hypothetical protein
MLATRPFVFTSKTFWSFPGDESMGYFLAGALASILTLYWTRQTK